MQLEFPLTVDAPGTLRPGVRTARTRAAVMAAVMEELNEHGYAGARLERVATRAGGRQDDDLPAAPPR